MELAVPAISTTGARSNRSMRVGVGVVEEVAEVVDTPQENTNVLVGGGRGGAALGASTGPEDRVNRRGGGGCSVFCVPVLVFCVSVLVFCVPVLVSDGTL